MDVKRSEEIRKFIAVEYPGQVVSPDKAIESLGGREELSKGFQERQKLQLKFRQNFFAKGVLSTEPQETTGMLIKVKVRRSKRDRNKKPEFFPELLGTITTGYKFNSFADYQFLPIQRNEKTGKTENIYNDIVPQDITAGPSWFSEKLDIPVFLPPGAFTRSDTMQPTILKNEPKEGDTDDNEVVKFAMTSRQRRATHGISIPFNMSDPVPANPNEAAKDLVSSNLVTQEEASSIQELFKERAIWTLASIRARMRIFPRRLSFILATIAFYYSTGPWRNCFVRFGYDPRKNFESRFFQMVDYRVRAGAGFKTELGKSRQSGVSKRLQVLVKAESGDMHDEQIDTNHQLRRKQAIFTHDTIPPFRARHYQFTDIHLPKIQDMLNKIPLPISGTLCNEKRGWLPTGFMEQCRDELTTVAQRNMMKLCNEKNMSVEEYKANAEAEIKSETVEDEDETDSEEGSDAEEDEDVVQLTEAMDDDMEIE